MGLGEIAAAEQAGQARAREELDKDLLRAVERAARRRRELEHEYEQAIRRAARIGLAHSDIATAAQAARATIRTILTRTNTPARQPRAPSARRGQRRHRAATAIAGPCRALRSQHKGCGARR